MQDCVSTDASVRDGGVTVALPVHRDAGTLASAIGDITAQSLRDLEILLVLNGSDASTRATAEQAAKTDPRVRLLTLEKASLAAALNLAVREARHDLVARMDSDDRCAPRRLEVQSAWMAAHPDAGAVGSAWERVDARGGRLSVVRPPLEPREMRWRLLIENPLAHGSMMLRRSAVRAAGGYDERLERGQDYDLWLRLSRTAPIGCVTDLLYTHCVRDASGSYSAGTAQAAAAAGVMLREWSSLDPIHPTSRHTLAGLMAQAMTTSTGAEDGLARIESFLTEHGPSREAMTAYLWAHDRLPTMSRRASEAGRRARLREIGQRLRDQGVHEVWLWGAGAHAEWVLRHAEDLGVTVEGVVDDALAGEERFGMKIDTPNELVAGDHALIASDAHEDRIWETSAAARSRGVVVWRLYGNGEPITVDTAG